MRLVIAILAAVGLTVSAFAQQPKIKDKQEPAAATADSQQGFSFDYCRDLLAKTKGSGDSSAGTNEAKIKSCMTTGKID
jgi:hypothetical protein